MEPTNNKNCSATDAFLEIVRGNSFCCAGAKLALAAGGINFVIGRDLRCGADDARIVQALQKFRPTESQNYRSLVVLFPDTPNLSEAEFEPFLWRRLQALHEMDQQSFSWDSSVSGDPASPDFGFSVGGHGYYVIGMHPGASRLSRRMPFPALAFNAHAQFRRLRADGSFGRLQKAARARDIALQGYPNPMLAEHGVESEARQYSGRQLPEHWTCPFQMAKQDAGAA